MYAYAAASVGVREVVVALSVILTSFWGRGLELGVL